MKWETMKSAPHGGTSILAAYSNNLDYEAVVVYWSPVYENGMKYEWAVAHGDNHVPESRLHYWQEIDMEEIQ